jgi:hypothetical protein
MPEVVVRHCAAAAKLPCCESAIVRHGGISNSQECALIRRDARSQPYHQHLPVRDMSVAAVSTPGMYGQPMGCVNQPRAPRAYRRPCRVMPRGPCMTHSNDISRCPNGPPQAGQRAGAAADRRHRHGSRHHPADRRRVRVLRQEGCEEVQGFLFGRALFAADFSELLMRDASLTAALFGMR